jgi:hypothetical protein
VYLQRYVVLIGSCPDMMCVCVLPSMLEHFVGQRQPATAMAGAVAENGLC